MNKTMKTVLWTIAIMIIIGIFVMANTRVYVTTDREVIAEVAGQQVGVKVMKLNKDGTVIQEVEKQKVVIKK